MSFKTAFFAFSIAGFLVGCASSKPIVYKKPITNTDAYANYDEDLTVVRPRYKEPTIAENSPKKTEVKRVLSDQPLHVNRQLDAAADTIAARNRAIRYAAGYRIQVYVGNVRQEADNARLVTYQTYPELNPYLTYTPPTYRIRIGDFMTRLEAERYLQQVRQQFEAAVVLPEKIDLKKSLMVK